MKRKFAAILAIILAVSCSAFPVSAEEPETVTLRIIATSDLHGKLVPWDYSLNASSPSGSMAQLATAVARYRTENTILVDAGDTIQDNSADIFVGGDDVHPMVQALNALDYDVWVTGNHEYDYGMDVLRRTISGLECKALTGNVYNPDGTPLADGYVILERGGVRVAVIGMVTPNIIRWSADNLAGCAVTDPLEETRGIIDSIRGQYDVLVGVFHMGIENEYGTPDSGVTDILSACPEFDVMVSSHEHTLIPAMEVNGVLVVQNRYMAQTMSVIDLTLVRDGGGWKVAGREAESIAVGDFEADPAMVQMLQPYDALAREDAARVIGRLEGGPLAPANEIADIPAALIRDTALVDLINRVQLYYSGAQVSAAALSVPDANLLPGDIRKCDTSLVYRFTNSLWTVRMTGAQLKKYMEWSAGFYNTFTPGDLTVSFNPAVPIYNYDMFEGVRYEIDISREPGSRVRNLTWPDGTPVRDDDVFVVAVNNYRTGSHLLAPGVIYEADDMPVLLEKDIHGEIGGIRDLIRDYITVVMNGVITPECSENWMLTGGEWDEALHRKAVEMISSGELTVPASENGDTRNIAPVTERDLAPGT